MKKIYLPLLLGCATLAGTALAQPEQGGPDKWNISKLDVSKLPPTATAKDLTYDKDIKPIFQASCFRCHGEMRQNGKLRVDTLDALLKGGGVGKIVVPGSGDKSLLVMAVSRLDPGTVMPPPPRARRGGPGGPGGPPPGGANPPPPGGPAPDAATPPPGGPGGPMGVPPGGPGGRNGGPPATPLTPEQVALVRAWIDQGAK